MNEQLTFPGIFPTGKLIENENFQGATYLYYMSAAGNAVTASVANVTFAPGARNSWHIHEVGQVLLATAGNGFYQENGKTAQKLTAGDVVNIPAGIKHWHGAAPNSWFAHIAVSQGEAAWHEPLTDEEYLSATK
jgi:quercetin dioxygenase-like cupin family protein